MIKRKSRRFFISSSPIVLLVVQQKAGLCFFDNGAGCHAVVGKGGKRRFVDLLTAAKDRYSRGAAHTGIC